MAAGLLQKGKKDWGENENVNICRRGTRQNRRSLLFSGMTLSRRDPRKNWEVRRGGGRGPGGGGGPRGITEKVAALSNAAVPAKSESGMWDEGGGGGGEWKSRPTRAIFWRAVHRSSSEWHYFTRSGKGDAMAQKGEGFSLLRGLASKTKKPLGKGTTAKGASG